MRHEYEGEFNIAVDDQLGSIVLIKRQSVDTDVVSELLRVIVLLFDHR